MLKPSISFTNKTYFEAKAPRPLLRQKRYLIVHSSVSTGCLLGLFLCKNRESRWKSPTPPRRHCNTFFQYEYISWLRPFRGRCATGRVWGCFGWGWFRWRGVAGAFSEGNFDYVLSPRLDDFIDRSWVLVEQWLNWRSFKIDPVRFYLLELIQNSISMEWYLSLNPARRWLLYLIMLAEWNNARDLSTSPRLCS